jgi:hypothetical protein
MVVELQMLNQLSKLVSGQKDMGAKNSLGGFVWDHLSLVARRHFFILLWTEFCFYLLLFGLYQMFLF